MEDRVVSLPVRNPRTISRALADLVLAILDSSGNQS
jgi:hypothetical protein